jgi:DNA-binding PadR family transcriptional regulator
MNLNAHLIFGHCSNAVIGVRHHITASVWCLTPIHKLAAGLVCEYSHKLTSHFWNNVDKKLLLLGLLRGQKLHGYGVVDYLNSHETGGAAIGKSNAYRLLRVLEDDGLIRSRAERDGNRPERHVYEVTAKGETLFQALLLENLAEDVTADQPGIAVLNYLDALEPAAAAEQLQKRRDRVAVRHAELTNLSEEMRRLHPALDLSLRQVEVELEWLDVKLAELRRQAAA